MLIQKKSQRLNDPGHLPMRTKKCLSSGYSSFTLRLPPKDKRYTASRNLRPRKPQFPSPSKTVLRHFPSARRFEDRFTSCSSTQLRAPKPNSSRVTSKEPSPPPFPDSNSRIPRPPSSMGRGVYTVSSRQARLTLLPSRSKAPRSKPPVP